MDLSINPVLNGINAPHFNHQLLSIFLVMKNERPDIKSIKILEINSRNDKFLKSVISSITAQTDLFNNYGLHDVHIKGVSPTFGDSYDNLIYNTDSESAIRIFRPDVIIYNGSSSLFQCNEAIQEIVQMSTIKNRSVYIIYIGCDPEINIFVEQFFQNFEENRWSLFSKINFSTPENIWVLEYK